MDYWNRLDYDTKFGPTVYVISPAFVAFAISSQVLRVFFLNGVIARLSSVFVSSMIFIYNYDHIFCGNGNNKLVIIYNTFLQTNNKMET